MNADAQWSRASERRVWTVNGDFVNLKPTGVARYAREVTSALDALVAERHPLARDLDLTLIAPREPLDLPLRRMAVKVVPEFRTPRLPQVWSQLQLPRHVEGGLLSFCNLAPMSVRQQVLCIHDAHTYVMPQSYGRMFRLAHRLILPVLGRRVRLVTTVSGLSRDHLDTLGIVPRDKIVVAYNGSDHADRWRPARSARSYIERKPFVLCIGRDQPYKNMSLIWRIAPALKQLGLDVLVAGDVGSAGPTPSDNVHFIGRVDDDELAAAMSNAVCFLFPSRIEGFGLPAAEAMARGCAVVASTAPAIPEVCGDAALYADPDDEPGWVRAVASLHHNPALRSRLRRAGYQRSRQFTWRRVAETYLELMARIDGRTDLIGTAAAPSAIGGEAMLPGPYGSTDGR
ncbi:glycosyltransferase family 4 protein [Chelatococcus reniformis]|uniref:Glycosyl transferase n=1 Tax=Chelatococcus reniformis TaxID=1494448 RepID=A0A916XGT0_9HYPH|nr:glycosyltransferase family 1 protein [Chelatococcus reniformis]GGC72424.1 glycosyl transferase [Chelatococcus reniformis]